MVLNLIEAVNWPMVAEYPLKIRPGKFLHRKSGYFEVLSLIDLLASTNLLNTTSTLYFKYAKKPYGKK